MHSRGAPCYNSSTCTLCPSLCCITIGTFPYDSQSLAIQSLLQGADRRLHMLVLILALSRLSADVATL